MKQFDYVIKDENGIHVRPAGLMVREAQKYTSDISIACNGKSADLKRVFGIMGLGIKKGDSITVTVTGSDEDTAAQVLEDFIKENF
ncbi:MAG: HPr family phosphocarrier protein [Oscillospiraceae bacterium]|jgi:phosphocarrier protein|nr:HPr family phosphocarrier protein [Oscillospiraceae bacterium]